MNTKIKIKDISLGKPDAKDEVMFSESLAEFCNKIILPPNFEIKNLTDKDKCYIVGNKGVGKTALLFFINNMLLMDDPLSKCSMILFKSDISTTARAQMEKLEQLRITNMNIGETELKYVQDFTRLWTLAIYKKVVEDNKDGDIFEKDTNWHSFENIIIQLDSNKSDILKFASDIPKGPICYDTHQAAFIGNDDRVNYPKDASDYSLSCFYEAIGFADKLFCSLQKKAHKYFICIDELEAYNSKRPIYIRDLTMIRDLIITTKRINALLASSNQRKIKVILSVRSEIVNSITRELPGLEYNKDLEGFAERINWSGAKSHFISHPLTSIWIRRIQDSLPKSGETYRELEVFEDMFPNEIGIEQTLDFVIDRTWQKPRDIIRMISCLHNTVNEKAYYYEAKDFSRAMSEYSRQSKGELIEELEAIYTSTEIDQIFICLTAHKKYYSKKELKERLESRVVAHYQHLDANRIIDDLYRAGVLGLINLSSEKELWSYIGQSPLDDDNWKYIVHRGLWRTLELENEAYEGIFCTDIVGSPFICHVEDKRENYLELNFNYHGRRLTGIMHAKDIFKKSGNLNDYIHHNLVATVVGYNSFRKTWKLAQIIRKVI